MTEQTRTALGTRVAITGGIVNVLLTSFKFYAGIVSGSSAMISDATHSASDIAATLTVYLGLRLADRPADETHHYGHGRLESIAAKIVSIILMFTGVTLGWDALQRLLSGDVQTPGTIALWAAAISIVSKEALYRYVHRIGCSLGSTAIQAEALHHRSDAFSSIAALAGIGGARLGYPILDPLAGLFVAVLISRMGVIMYLQSISELVDKAPGRQTVNAIIEAATHTPGVNSVNNVKARIHGSRILVDLRICVDPRISVAEGHTIAQNAKANVRRQNEKVEDVLVHVNPCRMMRKHEHWGYRPVRLSEPATPAEKSPSSGNKK